MWNRRKPFWILDSPTQPDSAAAGTAEEVALLREQLRLWRLLDEWEAPPVSVDFDEALYRRIAAAERQPLLARWFDSARMANPLPALGFALMALVVLAGVAVDQSRMFRAHRPLPGNSVVSNIDADQLENSLDDLQLLHQVYADPGLAPRSM